MPRLTIALFAAGLACAGCDRGQSVTDSTTALNAPAASDTTGRTSGATSVPASGEAAAPGDAARAARAPEIALPAGTRLPVVMETTVGSDISRPEEPVRARLARDIVVHGVTVVPAGSAVTGVVTDAVRSGRVKGRAHVAVRFDTLVPRGEGERYRIHTAAVERVAPGTKKKDALEIALPAAGGALIGGLIGGGKGALIGTAAGGGAGTAIVLSTRGQEIHLPKGASLTLRLLDPITVRAAR